ncbi:MAG: NAD-dependent epimerase/dehydratase family protein [Ilumatobacter sp.]
MTGEIAVVGAGWIGTHLATTFGVAPVPQREASDFTPPVGGALIIAGGRSAVPSGTDIAGLIADECASLRALLARARDGSCRVVVRGSSDVCGAAARVTGAPPVAPVTDYARLKAAREQVVLEAIDNGVDAVVARVAPVHGPGKAQSVRLIDAARRSLIPVPGGTRHSVGFITLDDLTRAVESLLRSDQRGAISLGAGSTPIGDLLRALGREQGSEPRLVGVPIPFARALARSRSGPVAWLGRFALPREVEMEAAVEPMTVTEAARYLAGGRPQSVTD